MRAAEQRGAKLTDAMRKTGGAAGVLGFHIRSVVRDVDRFINLRWFLVIGFLNVMANAVLVLGANLLALASSATRAAAALGGALVAGIGQLIPVIALLQLSMGRLDAVMKAVDATEKARLSASEDAQEKAKAQRDAEERLADARFNLLRANESVLESEQALADARKDVIDAERDHRRAIEELADARRRATENIVDSRLEEREAALALEEAELAVLDAKERLRLEESRARLGDQNIEFARAEVKRAQEALKTVQEQGDQALISSATQSLNFAENNLNAILNSATDRTKDLERRQLDVEQAEVNLRQARLRDQRQRRETRVVQREGVEGSDEVVNARERVRNSERAVVEARRAVIRQTRALRDANHNVALALREVRDAHEAAADAAKHQSSAQKALNDATKDLSAAEKAQVRAIDRLKQTYRKEFGPITDIITRAFTRAIKRIEELLQDPAIQKAAKALAGSIADVIDLFSEFSQTTEFRDALVFFTENAAKNVPKIGEAFLDLLKILIRVGRAATPLFNNLLDRIVKVFSRIERGTRDQGRLERFFATAGEHLNAWIGLANAIIGLVGAFIKLDGPAKSGKTLLGDITKLLDDWAGWIREHPKEIAEFFENMRVQLGVLAKTLGFVAKVLFETFTSDESAAFSKLLLETVVPAFAALIKILGQVSRILVFVFNIPVAGQLAKWAVQAAIVYGMLNRLFALIGLTGRGAFATLFRRISDNNSLLRRTARGIADGFVPAIRRLQQGLLRVAANVQVLSRDLNQRLRKALADSGDYIKNTFVPAVQRAKDRLIEMAKSAANLAVTLATRLKNAFISAMTSAINFTRAVGASAVATLRRFAAFIATQVVNALRLLRLNIRLLVGATGIGLILLAAGLIIEHWDKVKAAAKKLIEAFLGIVRWVRENWKDIAKIIGLVLLGPAGAIFLIYKFRDKILGAFRAIKNGIINLFREAFTWVRRELTKLGTWIEEKIRGIPLIGGLIAGKRELTDEDANKILADPELDPLRKKIRRLRSGGLGPKDIMAQLVADEDVSRELLEKIARQNLAVGGPVKGVIGQAVPILAHAGEWVLNKAQQGRLARRLGEKVEDISNWLFGTNQGQGKPGPNTTGTKRTSRERTYTFRNFNLVPQEDPNSTDEQGNPVIVWFIEMDDGTFGQVSARDAAKIIKSDGAFIPGYVKRSTHGFTNPLQRIKIRQGGSRGSHGSEFSMGGIVQAMSQMRVPSFEMGGVVQPVKSFASAGGIELQTPSGRPTSAPRIGEFKQHFEVHAESELDWNHIMRLGALHAQTGY